MFVKNGVPTNAIIGEDNLGHTRDNVFLSRKVVDENSLEMKTTITICLLKKITAGKGLI